MGTYSAGVSDWPSIRATTSEKPHRLPILINIDRFRSRHLGQARHGHDVPGEHDHEAGAGGDRDITQGDVKILRPADQAGIGGKRVLRLGHADRQMAETGFLELVKLLSELL